MSAGSAAGTLHPMWSAFEIYQKEEEAQEAAEVQLDKAANE